ncbi:hypothetical protein V5799_013899, partial [Amblyomma americanum]
MVFCQDSTVAHHVRVGAKCPLFDRNNYTPRTSRQVSDSSRTKSASGGLELRRTEWDNSSLNDTTKATQRQAKASTLKRRPGRIGTLHQPPFARELCSAQSWRRSFGVRAKTRVAATESSFRRKKKTR